MSRWSPIALPRAREQSVRRLHDGALARLRPGLAAEFEHRARTIGTADLYWVSPDMTALAVSAAVTLPEVCWTTAYRPSQTGLLVWGGGICRTLDLSNMFDWSTAPAAAAAPLGTRGRPTIQLPFDAVSWGQHPDGLEVTGWVRWAEVARALHDVGGDMSIDEREMPPLMPLAGWRVPLTDEPYPVADLDVGEDYGRALCTALAAAWALMQQPKLSERARLDAPKDDVRRARRAGQPDPAVTVVDLRRLHRPQIPDEDPLDGPSRIYRHRWVVSGHWRNQAFGHQWGQRRQTWVPSYVKGPDGAPLLETERVNVWRR